MADTTLLSWINAEVERALTLVQDSIAKFSAAPENDALLQPCPEHLHQVSGALRMVGLNGATLVCEAIESSFAGLAATRPTADAMSVVDRAVVALKNFVGELARGHVPGPVKYPQTPPNSGDHSATPQQCAVYTEPIAPEHAVHSLVRLDVLAERGAHLEAVTGAAAHEPHVLERGMRVDDEVLVHAHLELADPRLHHRLVLEGGKAEGQVVPGTLHLVRRDQTLVGVGVEGGPLSDRAHLETAMVDAGEAVVAERVVFRVVGQVGEAEAVVAGRRSDTDG